MHIPRIENDATDALSRRASSQKMVSLCVFLEHLHVPSIKGMDKKLP
jgi:hypothetical protein